MSISFKVLVNERFIDLQNLSTGEDSERNSPSTDDSGIPFYDAWMYRLHLLHRKRNLNLVPIRGIREGWCISNLNDDIVGMRG